MKTVLLTGGAGFVGHHIAGHLLFNTDWNIVFLDRLDFSGSLNRISEIRDFEKRKPRMKFVFHDLKAEINSQLAAHIGKIDYIIHTAASTHVDRSIKNPLSFVYDNVVGTANLLEYARKADIEQFIYLGTDEVFGPAEEGVQYKEWDRYKSGNPYAATKAGAEELCIAYNNTYKLPMRICHSMNIFGERQHPEKFIPMTIANTRGRKIVTIHADPTKTIAGSRFYIHARNVADAILFILQNGKDGEKYNVAGEEEVSNLDLAKKIAEAQNTTLLYEMVNFHSARPGHDLRYALDSSKIRALGWTPKVSFENSLAETIRWTLANPRWLLG